MARVVRWLGGALVLFVLAVYALDVFGDEPFRKRMERNLDASLEGYQVRLGGLDFSPFGFALILKDLVVAQEAHPDPPVLRVPRLRASVEWRALLHAAVVADFKVDRPVVHLDLRQVVQESRDAKPVQDKGWQDAITQIYPLEIDAFEIEGGTVEYVDRGPLPPVRLTDLVARAENIRNVRSGEGVYPSALDIRARVLDSASFRARGRADFLAEPHPGVRLRFALDGVALKRLEPVLRHAGLTVRGGHLSTRGTVEYAPRAREVALQLVRMDDADLEYVKQRAQQPGIGAQTAKGASEVTQEPDVKVRADEVRIRNTTLAYSDRTTEPPYRVFVADTDATLMGFTNVRDGGGPAKPSHLDVTGRFMNSGPLKLDAKFEPQRQRTDLDLDLAVSDVDVTTLNDLWRAYGNFDLTAGRFSVYTELGVHGGRVDGYVKPIFRDIDVYSAEQDAAKGVARQAYEAIVGGAATLMRNQPRDQVATETSLSGSLDDPQTSTLQAVAGILENAFFKAVLPGLDQARARGE
jgi:hypothetical protein